MCVFATNLNSSICCSLNSTSPYFFFSAIPRASSEICLDIMLKVPRFGFLKYFQRIFFQTVPFPPRFKLLFHAHWIWLRLVKFLCRHPSFWIRCFSQFETHFDNFLTICSKSLYLQRCKSTKQIIWLFHAVCVLVPWYAAELSRGDLCLNYLTVVAEEITQCAPSYTI